MYEEIDESYIDESTTFYAEFDEVFGIEEEGKDSLLYSDPLLSSPTASQCDFLAPLSPLPQEFQSSYYPLVNDFTTAFS